MTSSNSPGPTPPPNDPKRRSPKWGEVLEGLAALAVVVRVLFGPEVSGPHPPPPTVPQQQPLPPGTRPILVPDRPVTPTPPNRIEGKQRRPAPELRTCELPSERTYVLAMSVSERSHGVVILDAVKALGFHAVLSGGTNPVMGYSGHVTLQFGKTPAQAISTQRELRYKGLDFELRESTRILGCDSS